MTTMQFSKTLWKELMSAASIATKVGDYHKAELILLDAYEMALGLFGPDHGACGLVLLRLAEASRRLGKNELAAEYDEQADRIAHGYIIDN